MIKIVVYSFLLFCAVSLFGGTPKIKAKSGAKVDFGEYPAKERKEALFKISNTGDANLKIGKIRKTCGCAEAKMDKLVLKPGEVGTLKAVVLADSIYGPYKKNIYVESDDPKTRFLTLTISGKAVPILNVKPKVNVYAGAIESGKTWKRAFILEGTQDAVKPGEPVVKCGIPAKAALKAESGKKFRLTVEITPDDKSSVFKCKVKIPVLEPKGWKGVEIEIAGKVRK